MAGKVLQETERAPRVQPGLELGVFHMRTARRGSGVLGSLAEMLNGPVAGAEAPKQRRRRYSASVDEGTWGRAGSMRKRWRGDEARRMHRGFGLLAAEAARFSSGFRLGAVGSSLKSAQ